MADVLATKNPDGNFEIFAAHKDAASRIGRTFEITSSPLETFDAPQAEVYRFAESSLGADRTSEVSGMMWAPFREVEPLRSQF